MYTHEVGWLEDEMSFCKWFILFQGRTLIVVENGTGSEDNIERKIYLAAYLFLYHVFDEQKNHDWSLIE